MSLAITETEVGGHTYRIATLDTFQQYHVAAKLSAVLMGFANIKAESNDRTSLQFAKALLAMSGSLSDDDRTFCLVTCLGVVTRKEGQQWQRLLAANSKPMFDDLTMLQSIELMYDVLEAHGMPDFFVVPPATSVENPPQE